jgi:hypothetical protein
MNKSLTQKLIDFAEQTLKDRFSSLELLLSLNHYNTSDLNYSLFKIVPQYYYKGDIDLVERGDWLSFLKQFKLFQYLCIFKNSTNQYICLDIKKVHFKFQYNGITFGNIRNMIKYLDSGSKSLIQFANFEIPQSNFHSLYCYDWNKPHKIDYLIQLDTGLKITKDTFKKEILSYVQGFPQKNKTFFSRIHNYFQSLYLRITQKLWLRHHYISPADVRLALNFISPPHDNEVIKNYIIQAEKTLQIRLRLSKVLLNNDSNKDLIKYLLQLQTARLYTELITRPSNTMILPEFYSDREEEIFNKIIDHLHETLNLNYNIKSDHHVP